jgi:hypothetical protein
MACLRRDLLSPLQAAVLDRAKPQACEFFLTGGVALGAFYLHHRMSFDLDFFATSEDAFRECAAWISATAGELGARSTVLRAGPSFRRVVLETPAEALRVEISCDPVPQIVWPKPVVEGVAVDSLEDIVCNKIGALLGRSEVRDLIDLFFLDRAGYRTQEWWRRAVAKEGGLTPEILAHQVSLVPLDAPWPRLSLPLSKDQLAAYRDTLAADLARESFPRR